jgi:hypothetical protein
LDGRYFAVPPLLTFWMGPVDQETTQ